MSLLIRSFYFNKARFLWYEDLTKYSISVRVPYNGLQSTILTGHDSAIPSTVIYLKASGYWFYIWTSSFIRDPTIRFQFCTASDYPIDIALCRIITWVVFLRMFWNYISSLPVKSGGSLSFLVGTIGNVLVMEIGWTDVGSERYIFSELCSQ